MPIETARPMIFLCLLCSTALFCCTQDNTPTPDDDTTPDLCAEIEAAVADIAVAQNHQSIVIGVDIPGCERIVVMEGEEEPGVLVQRDGLFRIASVTKTFVAATILTLVDDGLIGLDDPIETFVPAVPNADVITIRDVLRHTSGLFDITDDDVFMQNAAANPTVPVTPAELLAVPAAHPPLFDPATQADYCNSNFHILGAVIESITGQTAEAAIHDRVIAPLALQSLVLEGHPPMHAQLVPGFSPQNINVTGVLHPTIRWTAGAMVSNIDDLLTWTSSLYSGHLLSPAMTSAMITDPFPAGPTSMGLGVSIRDLSPVGITYGHSGSAPGYRSHNLYIPSISTSISILSNHANTDTITTIDSVAVAINDVLSSSSK